MTHLQKDIALVHEPLAIVPAAFAAEEGAEATFLGVVRGSEDGASISAIRYSAYEPMALRTLEEIHQAAVERHGAHGCRLVHRLGEVRVGEPSIVIQIRAKHSALAFDLCRHYLAEVKAKVPIWKEFLK